MHKRGKDGIWRDQKTAEEKASDVTHQALRVAHKKLARALNDDAWNDDIRDAAIDVVAALDNFFR